MNIGSRIAAWFGGKKLPYDAEVEYLESTGTQYINLGLKVSSYNDYSIKLMNMDSLNGVKFFFGGGDGNLIREVGLLFEYDQWAKSFISRFSSQGVVGQVLFSSEFFRNKFDLAKLTKYGFSVNEHRLGSYTISDFVSQSNNLMLFSSGRGNTSAVSSKAKIAKFDISGADEMDLIPVRKDGVGYMYDRVSGQLFGNAGTGAFIIGPDKPANGGGYKCLTRFVKSLVASFSSLSRYLRKEVAR